MEKILKGSNNILVVSDVKSLECGIELNEYGCHVAFDLDDCNQYMLNNDIDEVISLFNNGYGVKIEELYSAYNFDKSERIKRVLLKNEVNSNISIKYSRDFTSSLMSLENLDCAKIVEVITDYLGLTKEIKYDKKIIKKESV